MVTQILHGYWAQGRKGQLLQKVRVSACGPFGTVLGHGSDGFHRDHFHLDAVRGNRAFCR